MAAARRVLFVGHEASRTGAPIVLLHFLRWFKTHTDIPFEILLAAGGELLPEFQATGPVSVLGPWLPGIGNALHRARRRQLLHRLARGGGLVYSNTVTNGNVVEMLMGQTKTVITHVHELETGIRHYGLANFAAVKQHTRRYVACAEFVKANLVANHGIDPGHIDVVHEFIEIAQSDNLDSDSNRASMLQELRIPHGALVVGASGTTNWRKGPDLFIQLARAVTNAVPHLDVHFVWVGGAEPGTQRFEELLHDIRLSGLSGKVHFLGSVSNPLDYFLVFDIFCMVSREDPFPLVCLEAASLGKPIVCFEGAGGMKEFVEADCGFVTPYLDIDAMAARTVTLLSSEGLRRSLGATAAERVRARHSVAVAGPKLLRIMESVF